MKLAPHEVQSALWQKLVEHYTPLLEKYRARVENPRVTETERIELCWKIASIKEFFDLAQPDRKQVAGAD